jgi:hypothetical protein
MPEPSTGTLFAEDTRAVYIFGNYARYIPLVDHEGHDMQDTPPPPPKKSSPPSVETRFSGQLAGRKPLRASQRHEDPTVPPGVLAQSNVALVNNLQ